MPFKKKYNRKKRNYKSKRKSFKRRGQPAGDYLKRTFRIPPAELNTSAYGIAGQPTSAVYDIIGNKVNLSMAGLEDASVLLHYFQYYRISKVITTLKQVNLPMVATTSRADVSDSRLGARGTTEMMIVPWRDGHVVSNSVFTATNAATWNKMKQQKGAKYISNVHSKRMLENGITIKQKPNTLDESFATQTGPLSFTHYSPQFNKWIANNYGAVDAYGLLFLIHNTGVNFSTLQVDTWVTIEYKGKIIDPLVGIIQNPSTNDDYMMTHHIVGDTTITQSPVDTTAFRSTSSLKYQNDPDELDTETVNNSYIPGNTNVAETI